MTLVRALTVTLEYLDVTPITRRQLDDLWEVKTARTAGDFAEAAMRIASDTRYPVDVVYGLLGGASPTEAWRSFRNMSRTALALEAGVSTTGLSGIERGMNSGKQTRDKIARALAIPADALIPVF